MEKEMTTKKHFVAINNETDERIEFGIEDLEFGSTIFHGVSNQYFSMKENQCTDWQIDLSDHTLYYLHQGKYYNYETGKEMVDAAI